MVALCTTATASDPASPAVAQRLPQRTTSTNPRAWRLVRVVTTVEEANSVVEQLHRSGTRAAVSLIGGLSVIAPTECRTLA